MCELLGISANYNFNSLKILEKFRKRGIINPDGWGIVSFRGKIPLLYKEEKNILRSRNYKSIFKIFTPTKILISHIRKNSVGKNSIENTHPFERNLKGEVYAFAHNGTLRNFKDIINLNHFIPTGETDSENSFCYLLEKIKENNIKNWEKRKFLEIYKIIQEINKFGSFNFIMSQGEFLFSYFDKNGFNGLCYKHIIKRTEGTEKIVSLIASKKLDKTPWKSFKFGELIIFKEGKPIFSNFREQAQVLKKERSPSELKIYKFITAKKISTVKEILEKIEGRKIDILESLHFLLCSGKVRQKNWKEVKWNNLKALYSINK